LREREIGAVTTCGVEVNEEFCFLKVDVLLPEKKARRKKEENEFHEWGEGLTGSLFNPRRAFRKEWRQS